MRYIVPTELLPLALIHAPPLLGVLGSSRLASLYGIAIDEPNLEILMRHRAVLFGLLAAFLAWAALRPELHRLALIAATVSIGSFVALATIVGGANRALTTVFLVDLVALGLLAVTVSAHLLWPAAR